MAATTAAAAVAPERRLWAAFAVVAALVVFAGFARTFYLRPFFAPSALPVLLWAHGLVMSLWFVLLLVQLRLVATGRVGVHRRVGAFGALLVVLILVVGVATAIEAGRRGVSPAPGVTPLMFMAVPLMDLVVFGGLVGVALVQRHRSATHKRLMLLASLAILPPGIARLPIAAIAQGGLPAVFGLMLLIVLVCIAIDTIRHRRLHPAFGWGGAFVALSVPARIALAGTEVWNRFAGWLIA